MHDFYDLQPRRERDDEPARWRVWICAEGGGGRRIVDDKIQRTAVEAARRKFSPEFMNRIDKVVVFRTLSDQHLRRFSTSNWMVQQRI